jgi:hypothetical protein
MMHYISIIFFSDRSINYRHNMQKIIQVKSYNSGFTFDNLLIFYNSILYLINIITINISFILQLLKE